MSERTLFVKLNEPEALQIRALSKEFGLAMEEILRRMVVHSLSELEAEGKAAEPQDVMERMERAHAEARRLIEENWTPEI